MPSPNPQEMKEKHFKEGVLISFFFFFLILLGIILSSGNTSSLFHAKANVLICVISFPSLLSDQSVRSTQLWEVTASSSSSSSPL